MQSAESQPRLLVAFAIGAAIFFAAPALWHGICAALVPDSREPLPTKQSPSQEETNEEIDRNTEFQLRVGDFGMREGTSPADGDAHDPPR